MSMAHLHCHTTYSANDSLCTAEQLVDKAVDLGMPAVAITDHGTMFGVPEMLSACKKKNGAAGSAIIKPILGLEAYVTTGPLVSVRAKVIAGANPNIKQDTGHLTLLAMNMDGYRNLIHLATQGYSKYLYRSKCRLPIEEILQHNEGLIVLTGCMFSWFTLWVTRHYWMHRKLVAPHTTDNDPPPADPYAELLDDYDAAYPLHASSWNPPYKDEFLQYALSNYHMLKKVLGDRLYVEMQDHGLPAQTLQRNFWLERVPDAQFVASNDVHYINKGDWDAQDFLTRLRFKGGVNTPTYSFRPIEYDREAGDKGNAYFKKREEFSENIQPEWLDRTLEVADRCNLSISQDKTLFPSVDTETREKIDECGDAVTFIRKICMESPRFKPEYMDRVDHELAVIGQMGYPEYFLIVKDIVDYAKNIGAQCGPGRGSVGGSLVAYLMGIHSANPVDAGLRFFRFLNAKRISMPDIDLDFPKDARQQILQWIEERYGKDRVCGIGTAGANKAKRCIQSFGLLAGIEKHKVDRFNATLDDNVSFALIKESGDDKVEGLLNLLNSGAYVPASCEPISLLERAEGSIGNYGKHASGIVICSRPLHEEVPMFKQKWDDQLCTQYDMNALETLGFCKIDILGLKQMDVINECLNSLGIKDRDQIPLNDPDALALINKGDTTGLFQIGTPSFVRIIKAGFRCNTFNDVRALCALNRPGPKDFKMRIDAKGDEVTDADYAALVATDAEKAKATREVTMIDIYVDRQAGALETQYMHPALRPILHDTYGVMIYQEQMMQIAMTMAGYDIGEADDLRKFCGKKLTENMTPEEKEPIVAPRRAKFLQGCEDMAVPPRIANLLWGTIEATGRYSFNMSHSHFYAMLAMWGAWLKAHYPTTFLGACLRHEEKEDVRTKLINDISRRGITLLNPDVNLSDVRVTWDETSKQIFLGFSDIKSVGSGAGDAIVDARGAQPYADLADMVDRVWDFCATTDRTAVDKGSMARLAITGAFNSIVPGPEKGRAEWACSVLTSESLSDKFRPPELRKTKKGQSMPFINNPVDRHNDTWIRLHDLGINMDMPGLLSTVRANKNRKKQVSLQDILANWPPVAVVEDASLMEATHQQLFGYEPTRGLLSRHQRDVTIADLPGFTTASYSPKDRVEVIGIVGYDVYEGQTQHDKPMIIFTLLDDTEETKVFFFGDEGAKFTRIQRVVKPGRVVKVSGWMRTQGYTAFDIVEPKLPKEAVKT